MHGAALAARAAADPCLIDLDVLIDATADAIPIRADHSGAKLVKKRLISGRNSSRASRIVDCGAG